MAKKSIKRNYIYNLTYQILTLLTPLITTPYISRVLGANGVGTISYAESIVSYFTLFAAMGVTTYGQREISYCQDDIETRSIVFWNTKLLEFCTSIMAIIIYVIWALTQENSSIYLILIFNIVAIIFDVTWFFQGMEEFGKIVIRNIVFKFLNIAYIFTIIKNKDDVLMYAMGLSVFSFLSNASLWGYLPQYVKRIKKKDIHPFREIKVVWSLFIPTIAIQIYTVLDKTMIGIITKSSFENGYYEQAIKLSRMVLTLVTALGTVMIPRIGHHFEKGEADEVRRLMYRGYRFVWFLGIPLCLGLISVAPNFVPWFFGNGYDKVTELLRILALIILAIGINNVTGMQYLIPTKRQNIFTLTVIIGAIINFVMNIILINLFKSMGAAIASVMAEIVIAIVQIIIVRNELKPSVIIKEGIHYYIAGALMLVSLIPLGKVLIPSIIHTVIMVCCGAGVYFMALLIMKDEFFVSNFKMMIEKVAKKRKEHS